MPDEIIQNPPADATPQATPPQSMEDQLAGLGEELRNASTPEAVKAAHDKLAALESAQKQKDVPPAVVPAPSAPTPRTATQPAAVEQSTSAENYFLSVPLEGDRIINIRSREEAAKMLQHSQQTIQRFNAERAQLGQFRSQAEQLRRALEAKEAELQRLRNGGVPGQAQTGVPALQRLAVQPQQQQTSALPPSLIDIDINADDFPDKFPKQLNSALSAVEARAVQSMEQRIAALQEQLEAERQERMRLQEPITRFQQEQEREANKALLKTMYDEVKGIQNKDDAFKTSLPFESINDIILNAQSENEIRAQISESDIAAFNKLRGILEYRYVTDDQGNIDLRKSRLKSMNTAFAAWREDNNLAPNDIVAARQAGSQAVLNVLDKNASAPPKIPPTASTSAGTTLQSIEQIIRDAQANPQNYRSAEGQQKLREAMMALDSVK